MEKRRRRITELPDVIIQHIQSFLETKEAAQTILISKSWLKAWSTRPFLDFDSSLQIPSSDVIDRPQTILVSKSWLRAYSTRPFLDFNSCPQIPSHVIDRTLKSYVEQGIPIVRFRVSVDAIQETWLKMARQSNVIELRLSAHSNWTTSLFQEIFLTKSLQVLRVAAHRLEFLIVLTHSDIQCLNLRKLEFRKLKIGAVTFQYIMSSCPLIDELILEKCGLIHLPSSDLGVQSFTFARECASLKRLSLFHTEISAELLQMIISKSPQLEDLDLIGCDKLVKPIKLSSVALKRVNIDRSTVQLIIIDAPNLHKLKYNSRNSPSISFPIKITSPVTKGIVKVSIVYLDGHIGESWFHGLREFLAKFAKSHVKFTSNYCDPSSFGFDVLRATLLPPWHQVETLSLKGYEDLPLLYAFFSICHPKMVLLDPLMTMYKHELLIKLLKDLSYDKENLECCSSDQNKCWRHYVKDAKLYYVVDNEKRPLDMKRLRKGWRNQRVISLDLEWESSY